jgi:hypothetical protein
MSTLIYILIGVCIGLSASEQMQPEYIDWSNSEIVEEVSE